MPSCSTAFVEWFRKENVTKVSSQWAFFVTEKTKKNSNYSKITPKKKCICVWSKVSLELLLPEFSPCIYTFDNSDDWQAAEKRHKYSGNWQMNLLAATCRWSQLAWDSVTVSVSAQQWQPEAKAAKAGETSRTVAVRPVGSTLRYMGQNAFSLVIIALCPTSNNTVKLYSEKGATSSKSLYGDCTKPSCKEGPFRHERRNSAYCDREGREFQETHQLQTLRVCSSRVYKKIQILDSSTISVKEVYTKMYSIYTAARTTPSSQMLLYSSLCTKRKKTGSAVALHGG